MIDPPMHADLGFPLTLAHVQAAPTAMLLAAIREWLGREKPACLMHPHGFYVVPLSRTQTEDWRFHVWPRGTRRISGMPAFVHTHNCHVESRILQGELINIIYDVHEVTAGGAPLYEVGYAGDRYEASTSNFLQKTEKRVKAVVRSCETIATGGAYSVERYAYHEAIVSDQLTTATLVCMHGRTAGTVNVVGVDDYPESIEFRRSQHEACEFLTFLSG